METSRTIRRPPGDDPMANALYLIAEECLRCGRPFREREMCLVAWPETEEPSPVVGILVCRTCANSPFDRIQRYTIYSRPSRPAPDRVPQLYGEAGVEGYVLLARLESGAWCPGIMRGHVPVWRQEQVDGDLGRKALEHPELYAYWPAQQMFGHKDLGTILHGSSIRVVETRFLSLQHPRSLRGREPPTGGPAVGPVAYDTSEPWWEMRRLSLYDPPLRPLDTVAFLDRVLAHVQDPVVQQASLWRSCDEARRRLLWPTLVPALREAEIILWQSPQWAAAVRGATETFTDTTAHEEDWPQRSQLWMFAEPAWLPEFADDPNNAALFDLTQPCVLIGMLMTRCRSVESGRMGLTLLALCYPMRPDPDVWHGPPQLRHLLSVFSGEPLWWPYTDIIAALRFIKLPIVVREPAPIPRPARRDRERSALPVPEVSVITLRRLERVGAAASAGDSEGVDWSCHWLVKGHWRRQWHPSLHEHRPMYIDAHLKGDLEKPFRPPRQKLGGWEQWNREPV